MQGLALCWPLVFLGPLHLLTLPPTPAVATGLYGSGLQVSSLLMKTAAAPMTALPRLRHLSRLVALLLLPALVLPAPLARADGLPELGDSAGSELTLQTEKKLGQQIMNEIRKDPSYLDDPEVEAYLNRLGGRLAAASSDPGIGFYFFPIDDRMINAFAMFGGYIGVNTGLLLAAQSESEVAGVLAHEVSHVTQRHLARGMAASKNLSIAAMAAMAVAILAARSNAQVASAAVASAGAGMTQGQLGFSREFEREADRIGFQTLEKAGFDVQGMSSFFTRLQQATRVYENNAPAYLRTHPLTVERISDMQNRAQEARYRQVPDSLDFHLVRAKLRANLGTPGEAVQDFQHLLAEGKAPQIGAAYYGLAVAQARQKNWTQAEKALQAARQQRLSSPMLDRLSAELKLAQGDVAGGLALYREAMQHFPQNTALLLGRCRALLDNRKSDEVLGLVTPLLQLRRSDARLYRLQAEAYAMKGKTALQHRAQAEVYALEGQTGEAIEQLELAQRLPDLNFYEQSSLDARLRELKRQRQEEMQQKK